MPDRGSAAELACRGLLLAYLCWLPLPFGSVTEGAQLPLIVGGLVIGALSALARAASNAPFALSTPFRLWSLAAISFAAIVAIQLVPLPDPVLSFLSPQAMQSWSDAERVATLAGLGAPRHWHPLSVDPELTAVHLFRVLAYFATFLAAALVIRRHRQRIALAFVLGGTATFEALYGIREARLQRYAIWGWVNKLIFNRVTGTFVNPNHFAHYAAIVLPLGVYLSVQAWHDAAPPGAPLRRRIVRLVETRIVRFIAGVVIAFACLVAILVAQSRGALIAAVAGFAIVGAAASGHRRALGRGVLIGVAGAALVLTIAYTLGLKMSRFQEIDASRLANRDVPLKTAFALWKRFPLIGSGLGTFDEVSSMTGIGQPDLVTNHAHNDYAEIAATTGTLGFLAALVPFFAGYAALIRATFGAAGAELTPTRRAYLAAALTSITVALVHALIDFNFFIPANPATLAAIAGAAVAVRERR